MVEIAIKIEEPPPDVARASAASAETVAGTVTCAATAAVRRLVAVEANPVL
jgi:hypothetical protein